jgi:RHS repeat-associated protein
MGGMRFGRIRLVVRAQGPARSVGRLWRSVGLLTVLLVGILAFGAASASAESLCTNTWTGPSEGEWTTAGDWSTGAVPTSTSVACIGSGDTVNVTGGTNQAGVVQGDGTLAISGGSLEVASALEVSRIASLTLAGGTLNGPAIFDVVDSLLWTAGTMSGSGSTVLESGGTGTINPGSYGSVYLAERTLANQSTLTWSTGSVRVSQAAVIENSGTFDANADVPSEEWEAHGLLNSDGSHVWFDNTGTIKKAAGTQYTQIQLEMTNEHTVEVETGQIIFTGGTHGSGVSTGEWLAEGASIAFTRGTFQLGSNIKMSGKIYFAGAYMEVEDVQAPNADFLIWSSDSTLDFTHMSAVSHIKELTIQRLSGETTLTGPGTLDVSGTFTWTGGKMTGSGATGKIEPSSEYPVSLAERRLANEGDLTWSTGSIDGTLSAEIDNSGTFNANADVPAEVWEAHGLLNQDNSHVWVHNTGVVKKTTGTGYTQIQFEFDNQGTVEVSTGQIIFTGGTHESTVSTGSWLAPEASVAFTRGTYKLGSNIQMSGEIYLAGGYVEAQDIQGSDAHILLWSSGSTLNLTDAGSVSHVKELSIQNSAGSDTLTGAGTLDVSTEFNWTGGTMSGSGLTVLGPETNTIIEGGGEALSLAGRDMVNAGAVTFSTGVIAVSEDAEIVNKGIFKANSQSATPEIEAIPSGATIINTGTFEKTAGAGTTTIGPSFENEGVVSQQSGTLIISNPVRANSSTQYGPPSSLAPGQIRACKGDPVSCATGNFTESQTDFAIGGRGVGLELTRTYNSQAGAEGVKGIFGYGWSSSFSDYLVVEKANKKATLHQADGATVSFTEGSGESFTAPASTQEVLSGSEGSGYTLTIADQTKYKFTGSSGRLESVTDRDGNTTTLSYNGAGQLTTITDPVSREIKLVYNGEGLVESAEDPMGHVVKYTYESGNLTSVTQPAEAGLRWQFKYDGSHRMTEMMDGRGGKTINEYNGSSQVTKQEDPAGHKLKFEYETFHTEITNETTGSVTNEYFTSNDEPSSITRGYGTVSATIESFAYNEGGYVTSVTDGNGHTTTYTYDGAGDKTSMTDPDGNETKWTYDGTHDVLTTTTPKGETTTIERDGDGNPIKISRPAPGSKTQITKYKYTADGELESVTDPLSRKWEYEYDSYGDRTGEIDPEGDKRTWEYNEDSQEIAAVSPRGNVMGGEPSKYKTTIERDAQGRAIKITDPLGHTTKYTYDGNGNLETQTDGNSHTTTYTYNADNEPTKVKEPNGTVTETEYDGAGEVTSQTDGNSHETKYVRNVLGEVTEVVNPLGKKTLKEYDAAGNLVKLTDPKGRTTTCTYDPANRLTEVSYSSGSPATVKYEYDKDGDRTKMTDGTGTTTYTYDQLDRLTNTKEGHGDTTAYEYNLANEQTQITYPNGKTVEHTYDNAGRLHSVTDWLGHATTFTYNPDSDLTATVFPSATEDEDTYTYNEADQISKIAMTKGAGSLASLAYERDNDGQVTKTTSKGLPGAENTSYKYDENSRLTEAEGNTYAYDAANNPTSIPGSTNTYNEADQLENGTNLTYTYDELGERTKTTPSSGPATTYAYDQAGNLTTIKRPEEGATPEIEDTYAYNGEDLRTSQTINGTTSYLTWDMTEELPLILSDETNSYIYGPGDLPIEQINNSTGTITYLHHDQAGSTRLLTGEKGEVTGAYTYDAYGNTIGHTGTATAPLGYDGQYTSSDTGLIYLRNRVYDPKTAQFLTVDPLVSISGAPYNYAGDNPLTYGDAVGLLWTPLAGGAGGADAACGATIEIPGVDIGTCGAAGIATGAAAVGAAIGVVTAVAGNEGGDEGEAELKKKEAERENCGNPATPPGSKFKWEGNGSEGSEEGSWFDPETREYLHPDFKPSSHGPHYDYRGEDGTEYRIYPDGRIESK